jgi:hypothetical protein
VATSPFSIDVLTQIRQGAVSEQVVKAAESWVSVMAGKRSTQSLRIVEGKKDGRLVILDIILDEGLWHLGCLYVEPCVALPRLSTVIK